MKANQRPQTGKRSEDAEPADRSGAVRSDGWFGVQPAYVVLIAAIGFGVLGVLTYGLQARGVVLFVTIASVGLLLAGAAFLLGGLIGFLFGIPRSLQQSTPLADQPQKSAEEPANHAVYQANTNLEQLSDWLTKILVGVGLTQIGNFPGALEGLTRFIAPALGDSPSDRVFVLAVTLHFLLCGFFVSYLWTRLNLPGLFLEADTRARIQQAVDKAEQKKDKEFLETVGEASQVREQRQTSGFTGLWVDDLPNNNERERRLLKDLLSLEFDLAPSTEEAITKLKQQPDRYRLVISDMSRPGDERAGYTLLEQMKGAGLSIPFIIYAGSYRPEYDREARRRGAEGTTNSPQALAALVTKVLGREADAVGRHE